jgi:hypothetical protein
MLTAISTICNVAMGLPGAIWQIVKNFFGNSLGNWWDSHYR